MRPTARLILASALAGLLSLASYAQPAVELPVESRSLSVAEAVGIALRNHPRIAARSAQARAAEARIGMAKSMTKPQLSTTTFATTGTMPNIVPGPPDVEPQGMVIAPDRRHVDQNFMAMLPLYTGGRLGAQVRSAGYQYRATVSDVTASKLDVVLEAKTAYRRALLAGQFVNAYQKRVDEATERVRIAEVAFREGSIAKFDLLRNQTDLAEAQQALVNAQRDVTMAMVDLKAALGVSQASQLKLTDQLSFQPAQGTLQDAETRALRQRPEIAAVRDRIESARAGVDVAKAAYRPVIYVVGMQDFLSVSGEGSDNGYTVGVAAAIPLVDGGRRKSAVRESRAMLDGMQAEERETVLMVSRDVATAWAEAEAAAKNVGLSQAAVDQADEDYRVIKLRYEAGRATNVEVLDALASLTRSKTNYAQALYDYNTAQDRLERATGTTLEGN